MDATNNTFSNGEIVVQFEPKLCKHSEQCCNGLSEVFRNSVIPWIDLEAATTLAIINQIKKCPSGALTFSYANSMELVK